MTILEIKAQRIASENQRRNVQHELARLAPVAAMAGADERVQTLKADLRRVNELLWDAKIATRACERKALFSHEFIAAARSIYTNNDRRAALKREINALANSEIVEEKQH